VQCLAVTFLKELRVHRSLLWCGTLNHYFRWSIQQYTNRLFHFLAQQGSVTSKFTLVLSFILYTLCLILYPVDNQKQALAGVIASATNYLRRTSTCVTPFPPSFIWPHLSLWYVAVIMYIHSTDICLFFGILRLFSVIN